ncbi:MULTISPECIES: secondary thiamine-phosphate synthase enzyme YjbQ [unclassified Methanopyrus]|uniref:secondary thiamine-phosphate synthase enzyme YjbQ n=1 Tax=Methanopyrus sp. SNP6 TaxID=1937005 RepID=UPI0011E60577
MSPGVRSLSVYQAELRIKSERRVQVIDVTDQVKEKVKESGVKEGIAHVYSRHTTATVVVNEPESGLLRDIVNKLEELVPQDAGYEHDRIDNNADAHLRAILLGNSVTIPVSDGDLVLGTWQSVLFVELDGPRSRRLLVTVVGE